MTDLRSLKTTLVTLACTSLAGGCLIYDNKEPRNGKSSSDTGITETETEDSYWLVPDEIVVGEETITAIRADGDVDYSSISELYFLGEVDVLTSQARSDELILTVVIHPQEQAADIDLVIQFADGTAALVESAIVILDNEDEDASDSERPSESGCNNGDESTSDDEPCE